MILAMNVLEKEARRSKDLADGLQLCDLCQKIPYRSLDLDNGYDHYSSLELLREAASGESFCHLCQMTWESAVFKQQRFNFGEDPLTMESWPVRIYGISVPPGTPSFYGY